MVQFNKEVKKKKKGGKERNSNKEQGSEKSKNKPIFWQNALIFKKNKKQMYG